MQKNAVRFYTDEEGRVRPITVVTTGSIIKIVPNILVSRLVKKTPSSTGLNLVGKTFSASMFKKGTFLLSEGMGWFGHVSRDRMKGIDYSSRPYTITLTSQGKMYAVGVSSALMRLVQLRILASAPRGKNCVRYAIVNTSNNNKHVVEIDDLNLTIRHNCPVSEEHGICKHIIFALLHHKRSTKDPDLLKTLTSQSLKWQNRELNPEEIVKKFKEKGDKGEEDDEWKEYRDLIDLQERIYYWLRDESGINNYTIEA